LERLSLTPMWYPMRASNRPARSLKRPLIPIPMEQSLILAARMRR